MYDLIKADLLAILVSYGGGSPKHPARQAYSTMIHHCAALLHPAVLPREGVVTISTVCKPRVSYSITYTQGICHETIFAGRIILLLKSLSLVLRGSVPRRYTICSSRGSTRDAASYLVFRSSFMPAATIVLPFGLSRCKRTAHLNAGSVDSRCYANHRV